MWGGSGENGKKEEEEGRGGDYIYFFLSLSLSLSSLCVRKEGEGVQLRLSKIRVSVARGIISLSSVSLFFFCSGKKKENSLRSLVGMFVPPFSLQCAKKKKKLPLRWNHPRTVCVLKDTSGVARLRPGGNLTHHPHWPRFARQPPVTQMASLSSAIRKIPVTFLQYSLSFYVYSYRLTVYVVLPLSWLWLRYRYLLLFQQIYIPVTISRLVGAQEKKGAQALSSSIFLTPFKRSGVQKKEGR